MTEIILNALKQECILIFISHLLLINCATLNAVKRFGGTH